MKNDITIRSACSGDAMGIAIVQAYTWRTTYTGLMPEEAIDLRVVNVYEKAKQIEASIKNGDDFLIVLCKSAVVGFAAYGKARNYDYPDDGELYAIYILKGFQGLGIGRELVSKCMDNLRSKGHQNMIINCLEGNPAITFYKAMGGELVGERHDDIAGASITEDIVRFKLMRR